MLSNVLDFQDHNYFPDQEKNFTEKGSKRSSD